MKLEHWVIIFIIIILPISIVTRAKINNKILVLKDEIRYNNVIDTAVMDGVNLIKELADASGSAKALDVTPEIANESINQFFATMAVNFNIPILNTESIRNYFQAYVPAIVVVAYDGFYIYSEEETPSGIKPILKPKIPYAYTDEYGNVIHFTLDNYITVYTPLSGSQLTMTGNQTVFRGYMGTKTGEENLLIAGYSNNMSDIVNILQGKVKVTFGECLASCEAGQDYQYDVNGALISGASAFHEKRREVITNCIKQALEQEVNEHNKYAGIFGMNYQFYLPTVSALEWYNAVNDISILAFVQGMEVGTGSYYSKYALGGARIINATRIYGTIDPDAPAGCKGKYHLSYCPEIVDMAGEIDYTRVEQIFLNKQEAAIAGYYPCSICEP